ncbi:SDR family NAD(P)-dependent oxidoreductase [Motiliproteus sp. MSK22-1]|uniref:SDR family NAD(P)-dependent oxidoreductase n=1 Tax=Motiliproteus sp. MSK22-1 TaxID=1897630 RepID=UPI000976CE28|nr:glucose 1-dehydrogenase [Motiliproteus sp. MSK22-1]OMH36273.1 short-chain dehydrogenase [Motiliproteus sp. MSK22-1]
MQLKDKVAIVTGGGRGIGRGISERFLEEGAKVVIAQRQPLEGKLSADPKVVYVPADLSDSSSFELIVNTAKECFDGLDILVNNAGIMFEKPLSEMGVEEWDLMMAVNLRAPAFLAKAALPLMQQRGGGSIVNIGSIEGEGSNPDHAAYCASKAGVHGLTRALAVDLGKHGIRCNGIAPGWIKSDLSDDYINAQEDAENAWKGLHQMHPIGRVGTPRDIGDIAVHLAGDQAGFLTGQIIVVDGGRTAKLPLPF